MPKRTLLCSMVAVALGLGAGGCASNSPAADGLAGAYHELDQASPNYLSMMGAADAYLGEQPDGGAAADALYLRGRALEEKGQRDPASPQQDFSGAYNFYVQALSRSPRPELEGLIRAGMGNTLYFQDRYAAAANELAGAVEKLERGNDKAWALYRIGICQQRTGQWESADATFATVEQAFANTEQARRAREHHGARAFWVQAGAFNNPALADAAVNDLKKQGLPAQRFAEVGGQGRQFVRTGPYANYESAHQARQRVEVKYQGAMILP